MNLRKITSRLLALFMIFSGMISEVSIIDAFDSAKEIVTIEANKTEAVVGDTFYLNAHVHLFEDMTVLSYEWSSNDESVAIVSGNEKNASVEAKAIGKVKITVIVNYQEKVEDSQNNENQNEGTIVSNKTAISEIELTIKENTAPSENKIINACEETAVETSDDYLDPVTVDYMKKHMKSQYAKAKKAVFSNILVVKNTLVDINGISSNETIDSLFKRDDINEVFIATIPAQVALYNTDDNSQYYVGLANTMINDKTSQVKDVVFALNNNNGEVVDNCYYDVSTGIAYIPKSLFQGEDKEIVANVQVQFLQAVCQEVEDLTSQIQYSISEDGKDVKTGTGQVDGFEFETKVETESGLSKSEMVVSVNGIPVSDEDYTYNKTTGIVTVPASSTGIQSVNVDVKEESAVVKIMDRFLNISEVQAISMDQMGCAGTVDVPSGISKGWKGQVLLYKGYASNWGSATLPVYCYTTDEESVVNLIYNGGTLDYSKLKQETTAMYLGIWLAGGVDITTGISHPGFWGWTATGSVNNVDNWMRLQCTHVSNPDTGKGVEWKDELINVRVLDMTSDSIIVGFLTKEVNTQSGYGIAKFKIKQKNGNLSITKTNANPELTAENNCYSLAGAQYQLKNGSTVVATLTTDTNGKASVSNIPAGTYTLVETKASPGFKLNTQQTSVTITAGQTTSLVGSGCLNEIPANDTTLEIIKNDKGTGQSVAQGLASLENAEFTVKYYNGLYNQVSDLPSQPTRTWILKTVLSNGKYCAGLNVTGSVIDDKSDDLYYLDGLATLPLGTLTIQETKAPEGYLLKGAMLFDKNGSTTLVDDGVFFTQIIQDTTTTQATIVAGNYPTVKDEVIKGKIRITKKSSKTGEIVTNRETVFGIYANADMYIDKILYRKGELIEEITTKNGIATSHELPYGEYLVKEDDAPDGFEMTLDQKEVEIKNNGELIELTFTNAEKTGSLTLNKIFINNEASFSGHASLEGNAYTLYALEDIINPATGSVIYVKDEAVSKKMIGTGVYGDDGQKLTDVKGQCSWSNLPLGQYYAKETYTNDSLLLNTDKVVFPELIEKTPDLAETIVQLANTEDKIKEFKFSFFKESVGINNERYDQVNGLNGATFQIKLKTDVDEYGWDDAPLQDEVTTTTKDGKNGYAETIYLPYSEYIIKETKAPDGYGLLLDQLVISFKNVNDEFTLFVNGEQIENNDENYSLIFDEDSELYTVKMTVFNKRQSLLPGTGSIMTVIFVGLGSLICLYSLIKIRKRKE